MMSHKVSRQLTLSRVAAAAVSLVILSGLLVACSSPAAAPAPTSAPAAPTTAPAPAAAPTSAPAAAPTTAVAAPAAPAASSTKFTKKTPLKIGYSVYDMQQPYWQGYAKGVQQAAEAAGYQFILSDQKSSQQAEVSGSIDLINQGISALVNSPVEPSALPAVVDAAHKANIPVVIGDVGAAGDYDAFVLSDNYNGGVLAAQYIQKALKDKPGTKEVGIVTLHPGSAVGQVRVNGFKDEMKKYPDFKVIAELNGNDTVQGGFQVTKDMLSSNPNVAAIYAANDPCALGAAQALKTAGKSGVKDVLLIGFNGDPPALDAIKAGEMAATIAQDPTGQGKTCVETAINFLEGKPVKFSDDKTKSIYFPVKVIDKSNVQ